MSENSGLLLTVRISRGLQVRGISINERTQGEVGLFEWHLTGPGFEPMPPIYGAYGFI